MNEQFKITVNEKLIEVLDRIKEYPEQTYEELVEKMAVVFKLNNESDKFFNEVQKEKMQEIWNNEFDEEWENA